MVGMTVAPVAVDVVADKIALSSDTAGRIEELMGKIRSAEQVVDSARNEEDC